MKSRLLLCLISAAICLTAIASTHHSSPKASQIHCQRLLPNDLCYKIGQMLLVGFGGIKQDEKGKILWNDPNGTQFHKHSLIAQQIKHLHIGGVIILGGPAYRNKMTERYIKNRNIEGPKQLLALTQALQHYSNDMNNLQRLPRLPLFIAIDQEGGAVDRLSYGLGFPVRTMNAQAYGAKEEIATSPEQKAAAQQESLNYAKQVSEELANYHFNLNFAPLVDVNINPTNPVIGGYGRSFSGDPQVVIDQAENLIASQRIVNVLSCLKHFPGHGSSTADSHLGLVDVTDTYNKEKELMPYRVLIDQGYSDMIMSAHVVNGQIDNTQCKKGDPADRTTWCPATMSYKTLTELLRNTLEFKGLIISDDMTMGAITKEYSLDYALEKAVNAGVDMFIVANNDGDYAEQVYNALVRLVHERKISKTRINNAYSHIVNLKQRLMKKKTSH